MQNAYCKQDAYNCLGSQTLQRLFEQVLESKLDPKSADLKSAVEFMQLRYTKGNRIRIISDSIGAKEFDLLQMTLKKNGIFIWSKGELEDYYLPSVKDLVGSKDIKALQLSYVLAEEKEPIDNYLQHLDEIKDLVTRILSK